MSDPINPQPALNPIPSANQAVLSMRELAFRGYVNLRGQPEQSAFLEAVRSVIGVTPPTEPNTVTAAANLSILWLAPNEWLIVTAPHTWADLRERLASALGDLLAAVTDVGSGYTTIAIQGREAADLLARGCAVDLHPRAFAPGQCAQTLLAKAGVVLVCVEKTPRRFHVLVRRSLARYLWHWLNDAARDIKAQLSA